MSSIGETLRRERVRQGLNLQQVYNQTRIGLHLLEAIEADEFDRLPSGVFARNFLRQYARVLGLDEEELLGQFRQQFEEPAAPIVVTQSQPPVVRLPRVPPLRDLRDRFRSDSSLSAFVWLLLVILGCAGVYSYWQKSGRTAPGETAVAATARRPAPHEPPPASLNPANRAPIEAPAPKAEFRPAEVTDSGAIQLPPAPGQPPAPPVAAQRSAGPQLSASAMRVAFTATEPVWLSVKSDGSHAYSGTLGEQESKQFDASRKMTVLLGNAGGVKISLNGKPVGPVGERGEIRMVVLTPKGAHVVPRTPPTPGESTAAPEAGERP